MKNWNVAVSSGLSFTGKGVLLGVGIGTKDGNTVLRIAFKDRDRTIENVVNIPGIVTVTQAGSIIDYMAAA